MSFKDIIKKSILENYANSNMSNREMIMLLCLAAVLGVFVFFVYRFVCKGEFYSKAFNVSLILMSIITATIIITIQSSVVVSLGMVGALSIVRFRTAVKNPLDLVFTFWAISIGIVTGAGLPLVAVVMSVVATIVLLFFLELPAGRTEKLIFISGDFEHSVTDEIIKKYDVKYVRKSENYNKEYSDYLYSVKIRDASLLVDELRKLEGVNKISLVEHKEQQF